MYAALSANKRRFYTLYVRDKILYDSPGEKPGSNAEKEDLVDGSHATDIPEGYINKFTTIYQLFSSGTTN